jgi:hypothetical protein
MTDLVALMARLVDSKGQILIPHVCDSVAPMTAAEEATYGTIDFDVEGCAHAAARSDSSPPCSYRADAGGANLITSDGAAVLQRRWRYPALSLHGVEGAFAGPGGKTVIPRKVTGGGGAMLTS